MRRKQTQTDIVFGYSYASLELFEEAERLGLKKILGQIDPGLTEQRKVVGIEQQHGIPTSELPSVDYWDRWHRECELADLIVVNSLWSQEGLIEQGVAENKIRVLPLCYEAVGDIGTHEQVPLRFNEDRPLRILYLGQLSIRKGILELIDALSKLRDEPIELLVVGDGDAGLKEKIRKIPKIKYSGYAPHHRVAAYYQQSDVMILPTHSDGFAITQLEAFVHGLPIIASPWCGDVIIPELNGIRLEQVSSDAICSAILRLLEEPYLLKQFRSNLEIREEWTLSGLSRNLCALEAEMSHAASL